MSFSCKISNFDNFFTAINSHKTKLLKTFNCNMDYLMYREIINTHLFPFVAENFNYNAKQHQDNDRKHSSRICTEALKNVNIDWVKSPPQSPDLNPIEWVWVDLKRYVRKQFCSSEKELITAVKQFWGKMTPMYCSNFI